MVPPRSRDTTAWFVPLTISNSRGRTSTISTRSNVGPSFRTTNFTSTSRPASARSRESVRTATRCGLAGGKSEPRARTMTGGKAKRTTCQLRKARPATKSARDAAARPLVSGVRMSRHLRHGDLTQDIREDRRSPYASDPRIRLQDDPMGERRHRDGLDVVRGHEVPSRDRGPRARHLQEREGASWTRADVNLAVGPRRRDDVDHVPFDGGLDVDVLDRGREPGLGLWRGAVVLAREEDVREDRAPSEDEAARLAVEHVRPRDVRGQQARREWDAAEREARARRERFRDQSLRQPRDVF